MSKVNKSRRPTKFRIALIDHYTHQQLASVKISKTGLFIAIVTIVVAFSAVIYSVIAFTPVREFIPGYPDAHSKRAAIHNAMRIDSLETVIYRWELYSENLRRVVEGGNL